MVCAINKIDSNVVGLAFAEEECVKVLPGTPVWYPLEPNEYEDFGGSITTLVRNPINQSRQRQKGVVADLEAAGGFSQDLTQSNLTRIMQGFMYADAHQRPTTHPLNTTTTAVVLGDISNGAVLDVDDGTKFQVGDILKLSNMTVAANNVNEIVIQSIATNALTTDATFGAETVVVADAKLEVVGFQFAASSAFVSFGSETLELECAGEDFTTMGLNVGEWIYYGGDLAANMLDDGDSGFARIKIITATSLTLEESTWTPVGDIGVGKELRIYFGSYLRNEKAAGLIKQRSYQLERQLGEDTAGIQSEYLVGAIANEFTLNMATADKVTADLSFMALDNELRDGTAAIKGGTRMGLTTETAFNTSSDVTQIRLFVHDDALHAPAALFAYVMEGSITINNNATAIKAIGQLGGFDVNSGDFEVGGELNVFFATVDAVQAIKDNASVGLNMIMAKENVGVVYDIPLLTLGGSGVEVVANEPIKMALEQFGAENEDGYTLSQTYFSFLPASASA